MNDNEMEKCICCPCSKICHEQCEAMCEVFELDADGLLEEKDKVAQELKEWNIKVETEHEEMINEYETRIDKLERALIEEDWKHRQLPKQIVGKIRKEFIKQYYESISFDSDEFMRFFDTVLEDYQGDGE